MSVISELQQLGGVARVSQLQRLGVSRHFLRQAMQSGLVRSVRRGWVALHDADPALLFAARSGTVLSCVTQAKRLGLWVLQEEQPHLATVHPNAHVSRGVGKIHWAQPVLRRDPNALIDPIENVLVLAAQCQPFEAALALWESAVNTRMVDLRALAELPLRAKARELLHHCQPYADSGLETFVRVRLQWLRVSIEPQSWLLGHRVDFLIAGWLVLQIDGGHHVGAQRSSDIRHDAELLLQGYQVIRCSYEQVVHRWPEVQGLVQRALARGPRYRVHAPASARTAEISARSEL